MARPRRFHVHRDCIHWGWRQFDFAQNERRIPGPRVYTLVPALIRFHWQYPACGASCLRRVSLSISRQVLAALILLGDCVPRSRYDYPQSKQAHHARWIFRGMTEEMFHDYDDRWMKRSARPDGIARPSAKWVIDYLTRKRRLANMPWLFWYYTEFLNRVIRCEHHYFLNICFWIWLYENFNDKFRSSFRVKWRDH